MNSLVGFILTKSFRCHRELRYGACLARKNAAILNPLVKRDYSGSYNLLDVAVDSNTGIATVTMKKPPVNSLDTVMLTEISSAIKDLESTKGCRGMILTSGIPNIFSAGLDIMELYKPKAGKMEEFWRAVQQMWIDLYGSKLVTMAAITGHSPAGGCLMAISCDYRVMVAPKYTIGLNETLLGIVAPSWFQDTMQNTVGNRELEIALSTGKLYSTAEALEKRIVDETATSTEDALQKTKAQMEKWIKIPAIARQQTKKQLRQPTIERLLKSRDQDIQNFVGFVSAELTQKNLGMYLESLKKKK